MCHWKDNNFVAVLSNTHSVEPLKAVHRKIRGKKEQVKLPNAIAQYSSGMIGVDLTKRLEI